MLQLWTDSGPLTPGWGRLTCFGGQTADEVKKTNRKKKEVLKDKNWQTEVGADEPCDTKRRVSVIAIAETPNYDQQGEHYK